MPVESFLINPVRRRISSKGLPSKLLSKMIKTYGRKEGMRKAWELFRRDRKMKTNIWEGDTEGHRRASLKGWGKRKRRIRGMARPRGATYPRWNPFGEEVMIVGANPRRRKRYVIKRKRRRNPLGLLAGNRAVTHYRRKRNPVAGRSLGNNITLDRPSTLLYPIAIGVASKMATERIPSILHITAPVTRYVIQGAIGIGGGMLLSNAIGKTNATIWTITSGVTILVDILNRFVFRTALGYIGEGEEDLLAQEDAEQVEAFPEEAAADGLAAFPDELGAFPYEASPVY